MSDGSRVGCRAEAVSVCVSLGGMLRHDSGDGQCEFFDYVLVEFG